MGSAMATERFVFDENFDFAYLVSEDLRLPRGVHLIYCTDSVQVFEALSEGKQTNERRTLIDIFAERKAQKKFEMKQWATYGECTILLMD